MEHVSIGATAMKEKKINGYDEWEIRDCADCLTRAEEIKKDAKKVKAVMKYLKEKKKNVITSLAELREYANGMEEESEDE